ncbi:MAG: hypothetical protein JNL92_21140 [Opitutaceae bacterium]|nr:hypothetical protein [Opitutaceae bacterium]
MKSLLRSVPVLCALLSAALLGAPTALPLTTPAGLTFINTRAETVTFQGRAALRLTATPAGPGAPTVAAPAATKTKGAPSPAAAEAGRRDHLALVDGVDFTDGTIEVDLAGEPGPGAAGGARGFVGVAFRVQPDRRTYDCFYVRPTNGRADDQERRNRTTQYISHPEHTWYALREKTPGRYESYVDITPATWIRVRIEVDGAKARLFVNGAEQPTLLVNDVKTGAGTRGGVALWFEGSTIAHFANLKITPR